jgi:hypothetical protein
LQFQQHLKQRQEKTMNLQQKPTLVHVIAWMTLASGVLNLFWGIAASQTALATIIGIFCVPLTILPTIVGIFEVMYAAKLFSDPPQVTQPSTNIAVLEIVCVLAFNVFSMAVGILSLVFYNDTVVKEYFARLNETLTPATVTPAVPASVSQPEVASIMEEPILNEDEESSALPAEETETPAKPKRASRKSMDQ